MSSAGRGSLDSPAPAALRIGFIGIGNMGWPMAANLVKAGHRVTVHDVDPDRFPAQVLTRRFASGFALGLLAKDVGIAADLGDSVGVDAPLAQLVRRLWAEGRDEVGADQDNSAIVRRWERLNKITLAAKAPGDVPSPGT